jgi:hypothetical protein
VRFGTNADVPCFTSGSTTVEGSGGLLVGFYMEEPPSSSSRSNPANNVS